MVVNLRDALEKSATGCLTVILLNACKTQPVWTGSRHNLSLLGGCGPSLQLGDDVIKPRDHVRLLGVTIVMNLGLDKH